MYWMFALLSLMEVVIFGLFSFRHEILELKNRVSCFGIFFHNYPQQWTLMRGWRSGIIWELHLEKQCAKCNRSIWKEWNGKWEDHIVHLSVISGNNEET